MNDTPFAPFAPFRPNPVGTETPAKKSSKEKKPRKAKTTAEFPERPALAAPTATVEKPARKLRATKVTIKSKVKAASPKFDLQTILAAAASLKDADMGTFEKLIGLLQDAGKPGRARLLAALGKVFE